MRFLQKSELRPWFEGKRVAIVGSGPGCVENAPGFVDAHDTVVRVNNYKTSAAAGFRTDVYYSFFGGSARKEAAELQRDGVSLCMCKCPNSQPIESEWHRARDRMGGVDFRPIYRRREGFWFCDTYIPTDTTFIEMFELLGKHVPTTGFAAILEVLEQKPASVYLTGFDFFRSRLHNVTDRWVPRNPDDPIRHLPERELDWIVERMFTAGAPTITCDGRLAAAIAQTQAARDGAVGARPSPSTTIARLPHEIAAKDVRAADPANPHADYREIA